MLQQNLIETLEQSLKTNWDLPAFTDWDTHTTVCYGDMAQRIMALHQLFKTEGVKVNEHIALLGTNSIAWATVYLATITYGAVIVPILHDFRAEDVIHIVDHSDSTLLFIGEKYAKNITLLQVPKVRKIYTLESLGFAKGEPLQGLGFAKGEPLQGLGFAKGEPLQEDFHFPKRNNKEVASINYTSGTTGFTKGVVTTLNALMANVIAVDAQPQLYRGMRQVIFLPLAHAFGCALDFLATFCVGAHCYLIGRIPAPKVLVQVFQEVHPTVIFTVPLILEKIYKQQIQPILKKFVVRVALHIHFLRRRIYRSIKQRLDHAFGDDFAEMIIGGAALNKEVDEFLYKIRFRYAQAYGMTECAPGITFCNWYDYVPGCCGKAIGHGINEVRIYEPNEEGVGEIHVHGETLMKGYYKNASATRDMFTDDGWLKTGDLGTLDSEGRLYIKGRSKTMLLGPNGQNIFPEEIESKLNNMLYVLESVVVSAGKKLVALVYPDFVALRKMNIDLSGIKNLFENVRQEINKHLAPYEQINEIQLQDKEFEKTPKKSIKRYLYEPKEDVPVKKKRHKRKQI